MAVKKRSAKSLHTTPSKYLKIIEGEVTADDTDGVVVWDYIAEAQSNLPSHGFASGGLLDAYLAGKRVRITIEEL